MSGHFSPVVHEEQTAARSPHGPRFKEIYETEKTFVWNLMHHFGVLPQDREDIFQEVFLRAFRHPEPLLAGNSPRPWLMGIAFRVTSEWRRHQKKHTTTEQASGEEQRSDFPDPEQQFSGQQEAALVERALHHIELERRAVFVAFELEEMPMPEIALSLGIPLNTAYSRLRLARKEFSDAIRRLRAGGPR
jgi:RNA polymerase sigma-70 factor (ECF subfamily)